MPTNPGFSGIAGFPYTPFTQQVMDYQVEAIKKAICDLFLQIRLHFNVKAYRYSSGIIVQQILQQCNILTQ